MLKVEGLTKTYPGAPAPILSALSFSINPGEALWVSGPSGSGKSTLLNILGLLTRVDAGRYFIGATDLAQASRVERTDARRSLISTVFQRGNLFPHLSVVENLLVGMAQRDRAAAVEHLRSVGMDQHALRPAGLLSGGEQARVAFARAAARESPILLADEPIAGLDSENAETVLDLLSAATGRGATVVVVSHDPRAERIATARLDLKLEAKQ